jgi:hypothetical protein
VPNQRCGSGASKRFVPAEPTPDASPRYTRISADFIRTYPRVYRFPFEGEAGNERQVWERFRSLYNLTPLMESPAIFGVAKPPPGHPFVLPIPGAGQKRGGMSQMGVQGSLLSMGVF